jgi:8-oxo-dGTP pyrophosphatase MutT (NUDIX family)
LYTTATSEHRILLLQRAETDDDAGKWQPPGDACDDCDKSILSAAAHELHEEAGLDAKWFGGPVGKPHFFTLDDGKRVCQFNFLVRVDMSNQAVKLSPDEHQRFIWATEDEVKSRKVADINIEFTRDGVQRTWLAAFHHEGNIHVWYQNLFRELTRHLNFSPQHHLRREYLSPASPSTRRQGLNSLRGKDAWEPRTKMDKEPTFSMWLQNNQTTIRLRSYPYCDPNLKEDSQQEQIFVKQCFK